jgi:L-amino acid N-acyltransferase YncA
MIRPATPADAAAVCRIYNPYVAGTIVTFETAPVDAGTMAARIRKVTAGHPWLAWEEDGELLGYAYGSRWKEREAYRFAVETTVYVAAQAVGRGIGAALYQALLPDLRDRGFHTALAGIALPNPASVALHEKLGFRRVAVLPQVGWKLERWVDVGYWALVL